ncbi:hypothetical protein QE390_002670 [Siphonobacter sp. SORGH_AS 1065]|nr:hypothetical protein [Siphonobacter sp. SORGH_AS_1065]
MVGHLNHKKSHLCSRKTASYPDAIKSRLYWIVGLLGFFGLAIFRRGGCPHRPLGFFLRIRPCQSVGNPGLHPGLFRLSPSGVLAPFSINSPTSTVAGEDTSHGGRLAYGPFQRLPRITSGATHVEPLRGYDSHLQTSSLPLQVFLPKLKTEN